MKKLLSTVILLMGLCTLSSAQFTAGFGMEYHIQNKLYITSPIHNEQLVANKGEFSALYSMRFKVTERLELSSLTAIYMNKSQTESFNFDPTHSEYTIRIAYRYKKFKIQASQACYHPILSDRNRYRNRITGSRATIGIYYNFEPNR